MLSTHLGNLFGKNPPPFVWNWGDLVFVGISILWCKKDGRAKYWANSPQMGSFSKHSIFTTLRYRSANLRMSASISGLRFTEIKTRTGDFSSTPFAKASRPLTLSPERFGFSFHRKVYGFPDTIFFQTNDFF